MISSSLLHNTTESFYKQFCVDSRSGKGTLLYVKYYKRGMCKMRGSLQNNIPTVL